MHTFEKLQDELSALHAEFAAPMEKLDGYWLGGWLTTITLAG